MTIPLTPDSLLFESYAQDSNHLWSNSAPPSRCNTTCSLPLPRGGSTSYAVYRNSTLITGSDQWTIGMRIDIKEYEHISNGYSKPLLVIIKCPSFYNGIDGHHFEALEIGFQYTRAKICGYRREAEIIADTTCAYKAKKKCTRRTSRTRRNGSHAELRSWQLVCYKFSHNEDCKQWLLESGKKKLYEATTDKFWDTGLVLSRARDIKEGNLPGQNKLGEISERVRVELN